MEWGRGDISPQQRYDHLRGALPNGYNGTYLLTAATIIEDSAIDDLWGNAGQDWFLSSLSGSFADRRRDITGGEWFTNW